jgi:hypothetical protein
MIRVLEKQPLPNEQLRLVQLLTIFIMLASAFYAAKIGRSTNKWQK